MRARANNSGKNPSWTCYEKIREVIEKRMFTQVEDLLPVISFGSKKDSDTEKKHADFLDRMVSRGYTERQVRRLVEWYMRVKQGRLNEASTEQAFAMNIIDRRPNPKGKNLANRQRFIAAPRRLMRKAVHEG